MFVPTIVAPLGPNGIGRHPRCRRPVEPVAPVAPLELGPKEGLALLNGTQQMTAIGVLVLLHAERLLDTASVVAAMTTEATLGTDVAFSEAYQGTRPHRGDLSLATELAFLRRRPAHSPGAVQLFVGGTSPQGSMRSPEARMT